LDEVAADTLLYNSVLCLLKEFPVGVIKTKDNDGMTSLDIACEKNVGLTLTYKLAKVNLSATLGLEFCR